MAMDPNKYSKNADIKADSPMQNVVSVVSFLLVIAGLVGLAMEFFKEDGWVRSLFSYLFQSTNHMLLIPLIGFVLWLLNKFISAPANGGTKKSGNLPMYIMMALGVYTVYQYTLGGG